MNRYIKALVTSSVAVVLVFCLAGCSSQGKVAATVDGESISEDDVTTYVAQMRTYYGCTADADWATFLNNYGYQPADIRKLAIDSLAQEKLVAKKAGDLGISVSDDDVSSQIANLRSTYGYNDDDSWSSALQSAGYSNEDDYFQAMKNSLIQQGVLKQEVPTGTPSDDAIVSAASSYTGKRASGIKTADEATADGILAQLKSSKDLASDFAKLYASGNKDTSYTSTDGDLGWTAANYMTYYYYLTKTSAALENMSKGDVQVVSEADGSYWVIYCTDAFVIADGATITKADIPSSLLPTITEKVQSSDWQDACNTYLQQLVTDADVQIKDMPEGLPYDVDMSLASTDSSSGSGASGSTASPHGTSGTSSDGAGSSASTQTGNSSTSTGNSAS